MRIICWNTHGSAKAWDFALNILGGDVLLFQESTSPPANIDLQSIYKIIAEDEPGARKARKWGNSTSVSTGSIEKVDVGSEYKGSCNTALINRKSSPKI